MLRAGGQEQRLQRGRGRRRAGNVSPRPQHEGWRRRLPRRRRRRRPRVRQGRRLRRRPRASEDPLAVSEGSGWQANGSPLPRHRWQSTARRRHRLRRRRQPRNLRVQRHLKRRPLRCGTEAGCGKAAKARKRPRAGVCRRLRSGPAAGQAAAAAPVAPQGRSCRSSRRHPSSNARPVAAGPQDGQASGVSESRGLMARPHGPRKPTGRPRGRGPRLEDMPTVVGPGFRCARESSLPATWSPRKNWRAYRPRRLRRPKRPARQPQLLRRSRTR